METLRTADGLSLHLRHWPRPGARGQVLIVHGLGEHIDRYDAVARSLQAQGWAVSGYDQRGHGRSEGPRGTIPADDSLCADLAEVVDALRGAGAKRVVLLGHSMGGLVAARFVAEAMSKRPAKWSRKVDALVLSSPALDPGMNAFQKFLLAVLGPLAPGLAVNNGLKPEWISRDPGVVRTYVQDPLVHDRVTPRLVRFIVEGGVRVQSRAARWKLPTLLLWAGADRCVAPAGSANFAAVAPISWVQAQVFPALFHEIFNEPERAEVLARLGDWLAAVVERDWV
jgi:alpha-beta hydrolase superfamily lysophospholipase